MYLRGVFMQLPRLVWVTALRGKSHAIELVSAARPTDA
jgi:hypothetical protein